MVTDAQSTETFKALRESSATSAASTAGLLPLEDKQQIISKCLKIATFTREKRILSLNEDVKNLLEELWCTEEEEPFLKIFMRETSK